MNRTLAIHVVALLLFVLLTPVAASIVTSFVGVNVVEAFECWCRKDDGGWSAGGPPAVPAAPVPAAAPVAAPVAVVQGRYIRLAMQVAGFLNMAEVQVFSTVGGPNVALGKPVTQSSQYGASLFPGSNLTDGNLANFAHTSGNEAGWFLIDLGSVVPVAQVVVYSRQGGTQERTNGMVVSVLDANQAPVFAANPFVNKAGSTVYSQDGSNGYAQFTITPPSPVVVGA